MFRQQSFSVSQLYMSTKYIYISGYMSWMSTILLMRLQRDCIRWMGRKEGPVPVTSSADSWYMSLQLNINSSWRDWVYVWNVTYENCQKIYYKQVLIRRTTRIPEMRNQKKNESFEEEILDTIKNSNYANIMHLKKFVTLTNRHMNSTVGNGLADRRFFHRYITPPTNEEWRSTEK